jgi:hypothetical protein
MSTPTRTWNTSSMKTSTGQSAFQRTAPVESSQEESRPNPFGNMRRDRTPYSSANTPATYADWKDAQKKKKEEEAKNRPFTDDDFPPLGGKVVVKNTMITTTAHDSVTLAERLRNAIKREEDEATRRRLQMEQEEKDAKDSTISLSLGPRLSMVRRTQEQKRQSEYEEENEYAWQTSTEVEREED